MVKLDDCLIAFYLDLTVKKEAANEIFRSTSSATNHFAIAWLRGALVNGAFVCGFIE